jgi:hypothetical protein
MNTYCFIKECIKRKEFYPVALILNLAADALAVYLAIVID